MSVMVACGRLDDTSHRGFGHVNADLAEFSNDARRAPAWIGAPHVLDELADLFGDGRTTRPSALTQASPVVSKACLLPGDDSAGLNKFETLLPTRPKP